MFDWSEYLDFARNVMAGPSGSPEARWRAAASRAYYAAFHKAREFLERRDKQEIARGPVHATVIRLLQERPETEGAGLTLERLRGKRSHADYNSSLVFQFSDAEIAVELATDVMRVVRPDT